MRREKATEEGITLGCGCGGAWEGEFKSTELRRNGMLEFAGW